ncbi:MAG: sigma factor-like helix-turn-helix DNA-binding protein [bacterium]
MRRGTSDLTSLTPRCCCLLYYRTGMEMNMLSHLNRGFLAARWDPSDPDQAWKEDHDGPGDSEWNVDIDTPFASLNRTLQVGTHRDELTTSPFLIAFGDFDDDGYLANPLTLIDLVEEEPDDEDTYVNGSVSKTLPVHDLGRILGLLSPLKRSVLTLRFGLGEHASGKTAGAGHTLVEIANELDMHPERIRQIEASALEDMREFLEVRAVLTYP